MTEKQTPFTIRTSTKSDWDAIYSIHQLAFERKEEAELVLTLFKLDSFIEELSTVAVLNNQIVGHVLFTDVLFDPVHNPMRGTTGGAIALAPLAVHPENQKQGIGTAIVNEALDKAEQLKYGCAIVLGDPNYYHRFGFETSRPFGILSPFDAPDEDFMVKKFSNFDDRFQGTVIYHSAFNGV